MILLSLLVSIQRSEPVSNRSMHDDESIPCEKFRCSFRLRGQSNKFYSTVDRAILRMMFRVRDWSFPRSAHSILHNTSVHRSLSLQMSLFSLRLNQTLPTLFSNAHELGQAKERGKWKGSSSLFLVTILACSSQRFVFCFCRIEGHV